MSFEEMLNMWRHTTICSSIGRRRTIRRNRIVFCLRCSPSASILSQNSIRKVTQENEGRGGRREAGGGRRRQEGGEGGEGGERVVAGVDPSFIPMMSMSSMCGVSLGMTMKAVGTVGMMVRMMIVSQRTRATVGGGGSPRQLSTKADVTTSSTRQHPILPSSSGPATILRLGDDRLKQRSREVTDFAADEVIQGNGHSQPPPPPPC